MRNVTFHPVSAIAAAAMLLLFSGCHGGSNLATVAPHSVASRAASFDKNQQNSGIISSDDNGFVVTRHFLDRHGFRLPVEGVTGPDGNGNYRITGQMMSESIEMDRQRKDQQK